MEDSAGDNLFYARHFRASGFLQRFQQNFALKRAVSGFVVEHLLGHADRILVDVGTTSTVFANELADSSLRGVVVATHSVTVGLACLESPAVEKCVVMRGALNDREGSLIPDGRWRWQDPFSGAPCLAILTVEALSSRRGAGTRENHILRLCRSYMSRASDVIVLLDHTKLRAGSIPTISMCGFAADGSWLNDTSRWLLPRGNSHEVLQKRRCRIVFDNPWAEGTEPPEYVDLISHPLVKNIRHLPIQNGLKVTEIETELFSA